MSCAPAQLAAGVPATSHAQFGEDIRLLGIFGSQPRGVCVEVGAYDGVTGSATLAFERRHWRTILVEPIPELAAQIRTHRSGTLFAAAAGPGNGVVKIRRTRRDPALSAVNPGVWQEKLYALRAESWDELSVPQFTLDHMLAEAGVGRVDFITIDVEGYELPVLQGFDLARWNPRVLIIEDNSLGRDRAVRAHLSRAGYVCFAHTGVNDWYARRSDPTLASAGACLRQRLRVGAQPALAAAKRLLPAGFKRVLRQNFKSLR
jgi:FkbM family methyltransferase